MSDMNDDTTQERITQAWAHIPAPVQRAALAGAHRNAVIVATGGMGLDGEGIAALQMEVLFVLLGAQTVQEFEMELANHPTLTVEQGRIVAENLRKTLFAELALYLPGMEEDAARSAVATLRDSIAAHADVETRLAKLPDSVQATIRSPELERAFADIQKRHAVMGPIAAMLGMSIARVMVGLVTMNDFKVAVTRDAGIPPNNLEALFLDVEQQLFKPVRTTIMSALENNMGALPKKQPSADPYHASAK